MGQFARKGLDELVGSWASSLSLHPIQHAVGRRERAVELLNLVIVFEVQCLPYWRWALSSSSLHGPG